jgi:hypothetical protein
MPDTNYEPLDDTLVMAMTGEEHDDERGASQVDRYVGLARL